MKDPVEEEETDRLFRSFTDHF